MQPGFFEGSQHASLEKMPQPLRDAYLKANPDPKGLQAMFDRDVVRMVAFKDISDADLQAIQAPTLIINGDAEVVRADHALTFDVQSVPLILSLTQLKGVRDWSTLGTPTSVDQCLGFIQAHTIGCLQDRGHQRQRCRPDPLERGRQDPASANAARPAPPPRPASRRARSENRG
jgi:hypothetical protein